MIRLFINEQNLNYPINIPASVNYIKRRFLYELERVQSYYFQKETNVNNDHILSRLIHNLYIDYTNDPMKVFKNVNANKEYMARQLGFVSSISFGKIHDNILYKTNSKELFVSTSNTIDPYNFPKNWMLYNPARIIKTNEVVLDFYNFDGTKVKDKESLTVVEVDINILLLMYNFWSLERISKNRSTNINTFVKSIVLPKLMGSCLDLTIWNRFVNISYGLSNNGREYRHPMIILNMDNKVDNMLQSIWDKIKTNGMPYTRFIEYVPSIVNDKMNDALRVNMSYQTKQSEWSLWVSRLSYISYLLDITSSKTFSANNSYLYTLPAYIRAIENGSTPLLTKTSGLIKEEIMNDIEKIKNRVGRR